VSRATVRGDSVLVSDLPLVRGVAVLTDGEAVPLLDAEALARAEEHALPRPRGSTAPVARDETRRRVLVVDDSELMRDVAASTLRGMGHEVDEAVDGRDALARIERRLPDLVVTDLDMPVLDGFALIERLRAEPRTARVPIVVLTSNETDASMRRAGALGADAYVLKSRVSRAEIERTVLGLFERGERT
jgi:two-component system chemotaxis sensor kinase CheA